MKNSEPIETWVFEVSRFALDGGAMFGVVPRPLWERKFPPDGQNRIQMVTRVLVIRIPDVGRVVVIDAGLGLGWSKKEAKRFAISLEAPGLLSHLESVGIDRTRVTDGLITHLHFDHAGGWTGLGITGAIEPLFPSARHFVQKSHFHAARQPGVRDRASFRANHFGPLQDEGLLEMLEGSQSLGNGIEVRSFDGHTKGLQVPIIHGPRETLVFPSDLIPTSAHINPAWIMAYDLHPLTSLEEKTLLLEEAAENNWTLVLEHDPEIEAVKIVRDGTGFSWKPCPFPRTI